MSYNAAMTDSEPMLQADLAIIGGGAAGVLVALNALRSATAPVQVVLFEPASTLAQGIAYATPWPEHLLNVPATLHLSLLCTKAIENVMRNYRGQTAKVTRWRAETDHISG
jgi:uncharacterized NAD(P)/FAD-binding protein YdhS